MDNDLYVICPHCGYVNLQFNASKFPICKCCGYVLPKVYLKKQNQNRLYPFPTPLAMGKRYGCSAAYCKNSGVFAQYLQPQFLKFHSSM